MGGRKCGGGIDKRRGGAGWGDGWSICFVYGPVSCAFFEEGGGRAEGLRGWWDGMGWGLVKERWGGEVGVGSVNKG